MQIPPIRVHNTLAGRKDDFVPWKPPEVAMYVCGITPYSASHFGHGMSAVVFDTIRRYLEYRGYQVRYVQNFTDIDDKIIARSQELGVDPRALVVRHTTEYFAALHALNIQPAYVYPRATGELDPIRSMIAGLIERGYAYAAGGDVYFRIANFSGYGKLARRSMDEMTAIARIEGDERKENPADFALWKAAKAGEPRWPSPWSEGRPGWHIECSAMSMRYLGEQIDIHGGGQDLAFPHHENEIAQSECFTGKAPFVRYWLHNGFVLFGDTKMSKSLGNVVSLGEAIERYGGAAVRLFVQQSHYRSPLSLTDEGLLAARRALERVTGALDGAIDPTAVGESADRARFTAAMDDDFNTPGAIAVIFDLVREVNRRTENGDEAAAAAARTILHELTSALGLRPGIEAGGTAESVDPLMDLLIGARSALRLGRDYASADRIRDDLAALGYALEDRPEGTAWRRN
ncbi:MAG: cysteine--tRNA ligase [Chloroflexi bacterium]|nr:cysteine--tRNA ligase [Chloroflexota bacterium]